MRLLRGVGRGMMVESQTAQNWAKAENVMNVAGAQSEMESCVAELRRQLAVTPDPTIRANLLADARQQIERLRKRFKHQIDQKASQRFGFAINSREGIERKLARVTAAALTEIENLAVEQAQPGG